MSGKCSLTEVLLKLTDALLQRSKASGNVVLSSSTQALDLGGREGAKGARRRGAQPPSLLSVLDVAATLRRGMAHCAQTRCHPPLQPIDPEGHTSRRAIQQTP